VGEIRKDRTWQSIHVDYIDFAVSSFRECEKGQKKPSIGAILDRNIIDTIRYSYDCLEASIEFVFHMGELKQLPIKIQGNWLTRYLKRKWRELNINDRIGMLSYAWVGQSFWQTDNQRQLFEDLKRVRDGLTHPVPFGTELEEEILLSQEVGSSAYLTKAQPCGEPKQIGSDIMNFSKEKAIAGFNQNPFLLEKADAEIALEIMLCHLCRIQRIFFQRTVTWFSVYDKQANKTLTIDVFLSTITRRFESIWQES
jgi:hypothetical protein